MNSTSRSKLRQALRVINFEARSVSLFAGLALGAALGAQAQAPSIGSGSPSMTVGPTSSAQMAEAFKRADTDGDGSLSREEANQLPAVAQRFEQLDTNNDGKLSRKEFEDGLSAR